MNECSRMGGRLVVGLDVHKETIVAAVLPPTAKHVRETVKLLHEPRALERLARRLAQEGPVVFVYEAGPCGYAVHRQLTALGHDCVVIAPGLIPVRPWDRVKTDRRDAEKLARLYRAGELTVIRVPTREEEAARDLVRTREDAVEDRLRARHRLAKFLLRPGLVFTATKAWGVKHGEWLRTQRFPWPALQQSFDAALRNVDEAQTRLGDLDHLVTELAAREPYHTPVQYLSGLKGVDTLSALTLLVETQDFRRFPDAPAFMAFTGLVSGERTSAERVRRGGITKAGNTHLRRILVEAAWCNRRTPHAGTRVAARRVGVPTAVVQIAGRAQARLHRKYWRLVGKGKSHQKAVVAVARELAGFVWAIGQLCPVAA